MEKRKVICPKCETVVEYKKNSKGQWVGTVIGGAAGAAIGGWFGSSMGIALMGTAISGFWPVAIVGTCILAIAGHVVGEKAEIVECPKCKANLKL